MRGPHCAPRIDTEDKSSVKSEEVYCHDVKEWQVMMMNSVSH